MCHECFPCVEQLRGLTDRGGRPTDGFSDLTPRRSADSPQVLTAPEHTPLSFFSRRKKPLKPGSFSSSSGLTRIVCFQQSPGRRLCWSAVPAGETSGQFSPVSPARCLKNQRYVREKTPYVSGTYQDDDVITDVCLFL